MAQHKCIKCSNYYNITEIYEVCESLDIDPNTDSLFPPKKRFKGFKDPGCPFCNENDLPFGPYESQQPITVDIEPYKTIQKIENGVLTVTTQQAIPLEINFSLVHDLLPTEAQEEVITAIEKYTVHVFKGRTREDATAFISMYMKESMMKQKASLQYKNAERGWIDNAYI